MYRASKTAVRLTLLYVVVVMAVLAYKGCETRQVIQSVDRNIKAAQSAWPGVYEE